MSRAVGLWVYFILQLQNLDHYWKPQRQELETIGNLTSMVKSRKKQMKFSNESMHILITVLTFVVLEPSKS